MRPQRGHSGPLWHTGVERISSVGHQHHHHHHLEATPPPHQHAQQHSKDPKLLWPCGLARLAGHARQTVARRGRTGHRGAWQVAPSYLGCLLPQYGRLACRPSQCDTPSLTPSGTPPKGPPLRRREDVSHRECQQASPPSVRAREPESGPYRGCLTCLAQQYRRHRTVARRSRHRTRRT